MSYRFGTALLSIFLATALLAFGQSPQNLSRDQSVQDARELIRLLESSHPDPYTRFGGKVEFHRRAQKLIADLPATIDRKDFAERLAGFLSQLRDGHTFVSGASDLFSNRGERLPIELTIASDVVFINGSQLQELKDARGYKVTGVNGISLQQFKEKLGRPAENRYGDYLRIVAALRSRKVIDRIFPSSPQSEGFSLQLETPEGVRITRKVLWPAALNSPASNLDRDNPYRSHILPGGKIAYLRIADIMSRESYEIGIRYKWPNAKESLARYFSRRGEPMPDDVEEALRRVPSLLDAGASILREMKKTSAETLIIDLRTNGGGNTPSVLPLLYAMYGDRAFEAGFPGEYITLISELYLRKLGKTAEQWRDRHQSDDLAIGDYRFPERSTASAQAKRQEQLDEYKSAGFSFAEELSRLEGKAIYTPNRVIVLCDPGTNSAAVHLMFYLRALGAKVVGVPPQQSPNAFMEVTPFRLPNSGIQGSISNSVQILLPESPDDDTYHPDFEMNYEIFKRYGFADDAPIRYAEDLVRSGRLQN